MRIVRLTEYPRQRMAFTFSFASVALKGRFAPWTKAALPVCLAFSLIGCAQQSSVQETAPTAHSSEYFPESQYGRASPRVIADGRIPRGGGQYLVGRPYTVAGKMYVPHVMDQSFTQVGLASWYGDAFHGRRTANGEIYDKLGISAAHPTMPLPSFARVTNLRNGRSIIVRVNDRGPYHAGRVMDVSSRVADLLDFKRYGMAKVKVDYVGPASLGGGNDEQLLATLTTGAPATFGAQAAQMIASTGAAIASPIGKLIKHARSVVTPRFRAHDGASVIEQASDEPRTRHNAASISPSAPSRPIELGSAVDHAPDEHRALRQAAALSYAPSSKPMPLASMPTKPRPLADAPSTPMPPVRGASFRAPPSPPRRSTDASESKSRQSEF